jgi:hypothetical protein
MHLPSWIGQLSGRAVSAMPTAAAVTAVAALVAVAAPAHAQIVYTPANIVVPDNIDGVYLNLVTGETGSSGFSVAGWDVNPYTAGPGSFNLWGATTTTWLNTDALITSADGYVLAPGTNIGPGGGFFRPGGGTSLASSVTLNAPNLFGVQFTNEAGGTNHFGWIEITFGDSASSRTITGWAFDATPNAMIAAGVIPEPGTYALMLAGLAAVGGLVARRRRQQAANG